MFEQIAHFTAFKDIRIVPWCNNENHITNFNGLHIHFEKNISDTIFFSIMLLTKHKGYLHTNKMKNYNKT